MKLTKLTNLFLLGCLCFGGIACNNSTKSESMEEKKLTFKYDTFRLESDISHLTDNQKEMVKLFIEAGQLMNDVFWQEAYGDKDELLGSLESEDLKQYAIINYGPWDRLNGNAPFIDGVGEKPKGAQFYPSDMTKEEFQNWDEPNKVDQYSIVRRNEAGELERIPYHVAFKEAHFKAAEKLEAAAKLAEDAGLKKYLELRAEALRTDDYQASDMAWMDMKTNALDVVIGPIENYEDQLFNYRSAHETFVLIKDLDWSKRLQHYASLLPELQKALPVDAKYKAEKPGANSDLGAYDVVYYAGDCNAGSKTIAINLPNDEEVQLQKGSRRLQLKNAMRAKFDKIMLPISEVLITKEQRNHIKFDAFFNNTMFHEVAHGLGIKNTIDGSNTVRRALKENYSAIEEGKADILGLFMVNQMIKSGELDGDIKDHMVTFMAGIFRSVRFGASSAHGKANMLRFNFFKSYGAFEKLEDGTYKVNFDKMEEAMDALSAKILTYQGDGDYEGVSKWISTDGVIKEDLQKDLAKLNEAGIPVDIVFEQGAEVLGL